MTYAQSLHPLWMLASMLGLFGLGALCGWCLRHDRDSTRARKIGYAEGYRDAVLDDTARRVRAASVRPSASALAVLDAETEAGT